MGGEDLISDVLFEYKGDLSVISNIIADWNGSSLTADVVAVPDAFAMSPAYPNPFNPSTSISLSISDAGNVNVSVYNLKGQMVSALAEGYMNAGNYTFNWDASDQVSGMYLIKAETGGNVSIQKLLLIK